MMTPAAAAAAAGHDPEAVSRILLSLAFVLVGARLAGLLVERAGLPAVLGELGVGVLLGNIALPGIDALRESEAFLVLAELGAILLLFEVGLESTPREMRAVGGAALLVAVVGVVTPMLLGFGVGRLMRPHDSWMLHAFLGAMLSATSVGITARVLSDLDALRLPAARIILGAAVIDDVLGLLVLAVITGVITAAASATAVGLGSLLVIVVKALLFLGGSLIVGGFLSPRVFRSSFAAGSKGLVHAIALSFCFFLAWLAQLAGLAPIVGAFAAGLVLEEVHFDEAVRRGERPLHETLVPLTALLVPVFFVRMGLLVDLGSFLHGGVLAFALVLTAAAVAGKLACSLVTPRGVPRLTVGLGMMPRGEVGLIFAGIGAQLVLGGQPVVDASAYAAAVFMVVATTMATPPLLAWALRRGI